MEGFSWPVASGLQFLPATAPTGLAHAGSTVPDLAAETAPKPKLPKHRQEQVLKAAGVGETSWLKNLAEQHHEAFTKELKHERVMAPDGVVRIATSCTGTGQEVFTLLAIVNV